MATQTSLRQQTLPQPTHKDLKRVNACISKAKQDTRFAIRLMPIPMDDLALFGHADAALQNASRKGSQAGFLIAAGEEKIYRGQETP